MNNRDNSALHRLRHRLRLGEALATWAGVVGLPFWGRKALTHRGNLMNNRDNSALHRLRHRLRLGEALATWAGVVGLPPWGRKALTHRET